MGDSEDGVECPLCGVRYDISVIERHAATCDGTPARFSPEQMPVKKARTFDKPAEADPASSDPDYLLALKLQAEFDAENERDHSSGVVCGLCNKTVSVDQLYILDVCPKSYHSSHFVVHVHLFFLFNT